MESPLDFWDNFNGFNIPQESNGNVLVSLPPPLRLQPMHPAVMHQMRQLGALPPQQQQQQQMYPVPQTYAAPAPAAASAPSAPERPRGAQAQSHPAWLDRLVGNHFFAPCPTHPEHKKNDQTFFCVDCMARLCQHCCPAHEGHALLQVRRYVYCDVVRSQDIQRYFDVSGIQQYTINSARVLFLHAKANQVVQGAKQGGAGADPRSTFHPHPHPHGAHMGGAAALPHSACGVCSRPVRDGAAFCSLGCKLGGGARPLSAGPRTSSSSSEEGVPVGHVGHGAAAHGPGRTPQGGAVHSHTVHAPKAQYGSFPVPAGPVGFTLQRLSPLGTVHRPDDVLESPSKRVRSLALESPTSKREQFQHSLPQIELQLLASQAGYQGGTGVMGPIFPGAAGGEEYGEGMVAESNHSRRKGGSPRRSPLDEAPLSVLSIW